MFFSAITKNLNWEILTKNLVIFKRWDGGEWKVLILCGFPEKSDSSGGSWKTSI